MDYVKLGQRIREERTRLRLTQEKLAEDVGVSDAYIGQIERGERSVTLETLVKIVNRLGVTIDYLVSDSVKVKDDKVVKQLVQIMDGKTIKQKQMAIDVISVMFRHLDK